MLINDKVDAVFIPDSPSRIKATDYNQIKNEIQECITEAGLTPTKDVIQLPQALKILTAQSGAEEVAKIEAAGAEQLQAVNTAGQTQLNAINTAGAQAVQDAQDAANTATAKATEAASSATAAASSATAASGSASTAATQATNASASAELAQKWATQTTAEVVSGQGYGAKYYADQAADSAASIVQDAEAAAASATAAANSASAAAQSAQEAADSAASINTDNLAKVDLSNVSQLPQSRINAIMPANMDYVVESKAATDTDPSWYRIYKSGWLEQGGIQTQGSGFTFSLIKPFKNTKYFVSAQMVSNSPNTNNVFVSFLNLRAQTTTYFQLEFTTYSDTVWYTCGQGA